jgi:hypothetical protein
MATNTTNFNFIKPSVNDAADQDLWGGYLNENWDSADAILKSARDMAISTKTGAYTVTADDRNALIQGDATSASFSISFPTAASVGSGFKISFKKTDSSTNTVTLDFNGSETADGQATYVMDTQYQAVLIVSDGTNWKILATHAGWGADGELLTSQGAGTSAKFEALNTVFSESFESAEQTISTGGTITIPHSLSSEPLIIQGHIVCKTAELGFSVGDKLIVSPNTGDTGADTNYNIEFGDTNIIVQYGDGSGTSGRVFVAVNSSGNGVSLTNANWRLVVRAYA